MLKSRLLLSASAAFALGALGAPAMASKPMYVACSYEDPASGAVVPSLLFLVGEVAIFEGRGAFTHDRTVDWEMQFPPPKNNVRPIGSYRLSNLVGQFHQFAESRGDRDATCWVTTEKARAALWYSTTEAKSRVDSGLIRDWRPSGVPLLGVEDWDGRIVRRGTALAAGGDADSGKAAAGEADSALAESAPAMPKRPKKTNAEADAEYAAAMELYEKQVAEQQAAVAEFQRKKDEMARTKAAQSMAVNEASSDYQKRLADHAAKVQAQQLEYKKTLARPAGVANAVYRNFAGTSCDDAQRAAKSGGDANFVPVTTKRSGGSCTVEGWWWNG